MKDPDKIFEQLCLFLERQLQGRLHLSGITFGQKIYQLLPGYKEVVPLGNQE